MRIIAGSHKRRAINPPTGFRARPTTDFAKENLFNVLSNYFDFEELAVLDLFSGTGSISYEFASREARRVLSIEVNPTHHRFIQKTARELKLDNLKAVCTNAFVYLRSTQTEQFDIIFADPPYDLPELPQLPDMILTANILNNDGWLIVEHGADNDFAQHPKFKETRRYGSVNFSIFGAI